MTSLLSVCLALLLPACVLGQPYLRSSELLYQRCRTAIDAFEACDSAFFRSLNVTEDAYKTLDGTFICSHIDAWVSHTECVNAALTTCQPTHLDLVVEADSMRRSQVYWCEHRNQIRWECAMRYPAAEACFENVTNRFDQEVADAGLTERVCSYLNRVDECYMKVGANCEGHDSEIYSNYWKLTYPPACASASVLLPSSFLLLSACALLLSKMAALL